MWKLKFPHIIPAGVGSTCCFDFVLKIKKSYIFFLVCELCDNLRAEIKFIKGGSLPSVESDPHAPPLPPDSGLFQATRSKKAESLKILNSQLEGHLIDAKTRRKMASDAQKSAQVTPNKETLFLDGMGYLSFSFCLLPQSIRISSFISNRFFYRFLNFLFSSKFIPDQPRAPLDRSRHVQVHFYGQVLSSVDKVRMRVYTEPWFENSSIIIQTLDDTLTNIAKQGKKDVTLIFDNKSDQHAFSVLGYLYYVTVTKKLFGPDGRVTIIYLHHGHHFNLADRKFSEASSAIVHNWKANGQADFVHPSQIVDALNEKRSFEASLAYTFLEASEKFSSFSVIGPKGESLNQGFIGVSTLTSILIKNESETEPRAAGIFTKSRATDSDWGVHRGLQMNLDGFHLHFAEDPFGSPFPSMPEPILSNDKCQKLAQKIETYRNRPGNYNWDYIDHLAKQKPLALLGQPRKTLSSYDFLRTIPEPPFIPPVENILVEAGAVDTIPEFTVEKISDSGWVLDEHERPLFMLKTHWADKTVSWVPWSSFVDDKVNEALLRYMDTTRYKDHYSHLNGPTISKNDLNKLLEELKSAKSKENEPQKLHEDPKSSKSKVIGLQIKSKKRKAEAIEPLNENKMEEKRLAHDRKAEDDRKVFKDAEKRLKRPRKGEKEPNNEDKGPN